MSNQVLRWSGSSVAVAVVGAFVLMAGTAPALVPVPLAGALYGELTAPQGGAPFGGASIGQWQLAYAGHEVVIVAQVLPDPPAGFVLEGWLVDVDSGFKRSIGLLALNKVMVFEEALLNPYVYDVLVITLEPENDPDPNAFAPFGGSPLPAPFGQ